MSRIYLAPDDEITSVIEKLRESDDHVILIAPKGTSLLQSVINIRLLKKKADELKKTLGIVTTDPVGSHLATQVGLAVYTQVEDVPKADKVPAHRPPKHLEQNDDPEPQKQHRAALPHIEPEVAVKQYESGSAAAPVSDATAADGLPKVLPKDDLVESEQSDHMDHEDLPDESGASAESTVSHASGSNQPPHHRPPLRPKRRPLPGWIPRAVLIIIVLLLLSGVAAASFIPQATLTFHVPAESIKRSVVITVDVGAGSVDGTTIPSVKRDASVDATGSAKATGKKEVGDKAKGSVTISNSWSTSAESFAKNTGLVSAEKSLLFRTATDVSVPGATVTLVNGVPTITPGKADVAVEADQAGDQYNIGPSKFTIQGLSADKSAKITGQSAKAMAGGTTKELTVIAAADIDQARADAKTKAEAGAADALKQAVAVDEVLLGKMTSVSSILKDPDHAAGDEADTVSVPATGAAEGYAFKTNDLEQGVKSIFQQDLPSTKSIILPDLAAVDWTVATKAQGKFELSKEIEGQLVTEVDAAAARSKAAHRRVSSIGQSLSGDFGAASVDVEIKPHGWPLMPLIPSRIAVKTTE